MKRQSKSVRARWRPKKKPGAMNATELRFEANVLKPRLWAGEIVGYAYEAVKFRYGVDWKATYTPDFMVLRADGEIELVDVKGSGGWEEHTRVKIKACAALHPQFHWIGQMESKSRRGEFISEEF